jgi:aspartyl-tRNA(Asn)/glutamyl-tRNA(Gln) amidotransferase subunit C
MALTRQQVLHVAGLARLDLSDAEVSQLETDLGRILAHVDTLASVDTSCVGATEYVSVQQLPFRPDVPVAGVTHDAALAPAPRVLAGSFAVPAFVDE